MDLARTLRKHNRQLGYDVIAVRGDALTARDPETGFVYEGDLATPSGVMDQVRRVHEMVYHARGRAQYHQQSGQCGLCGKPLRGTQGTEIDHIQARSKGRDDRRDNLRVVHSECHRKRHGG